MRFLISFLITSLFVVTASAQTCPGRGSINFQRWDNITGTSITSLTSKYRYPNTPTSTGIRTLFEMPVNQGSNLGIKMYGYICAPASGSYRFWIASDASGELWLSTTSSPANKVRIAYNTSSTSSRQWNKSSTQRSAFITLAANQVYYVEALMKESSGNDNLAVGWSKPGQSTTSPSEVIPGTVLMTQNIADSIPPSAPSALSAAAHTQTSFVLRWNASTDNVGVAGYDIYKDSVKINASMVSANTYTVSGLTPAATASYSVKAKDATGNTSAFSAALSTTTLAGGSPAESFTMRTVIGNQRMPHDLVYGPDGNIWFTERFAGKVSIVEPVSGVKTTALTLGAAMVRVGGQDGLMGLALHPQFTSGKPYVYISYTYNSTSATVRKIRIARYTYNEISRTLDSAATILENIPGSNDHNSARLAISSDHKLFYTAGDMGAGQFDNINRVQQAQNLSVYEGKILRLNTEPVNGSWIPADNPYTAAASAAIYSYGHRNPQGLVFGTNGLLYSSEHGPFSDDELNIIENGRNYGWPNVIGWCDGNYNGRTTGGFTIVNEQANCSTLQVKEPIRSLFPAANPPSSGDIMQWPSVGHSGMDYYGSDAIPGWQGSLLVAQLKKGAVARYKLSSDGSSIISDTIHYFKGLGRFRDVIVSPDGLKIYVACDSSGSTSGPTGGSTTVPANAGSILEFTYVPQSARNIDVFDPERAAVTRSKNSDIDIYPNPASTYIVVYIYRDFNNTSVDLYDMSGRMVSRSPVNTTATRIETGHLQNGIYVLKVSDANGKTIRTEKIIIQK